MSDLGITNLLPGSVFAADFRIVRRLSQGGMGTVFVAEQLSTGKPRALKLMLPQLVADPVLRMRFAQEARIGSQIDSEHVVEVVGAGVDAATGMPWLAMELLRGEDLSQVIAHRGAMPVGEVLAVFEQLCHALGAAHAAGIVHRDLKPENLFLAEARRAGAAFTLKVLDFGIAKITQEATTKGTQAMGSPIWMAPEQSERSPVTPATDVWALGLIAFHLMTGGFFWRAARREDATVMELMREILFEAVPPASNRAAELGVALPASFDTWFARCVTREPSSRFPNATVAFAELRGLLTGAPRPVASTVNMEPPRVATVAYTGPHGTAPNARLLLGATAQGSTRLAGAYTLADPPNLHAQTPAPPGRAARVLALLILVAIAAIGATVTVVTWLVSRDTSGPVAVSSAFPSPPVTPGGAASPAARAEPGDPTAPAPGDLALGDAGLGSLGPAPSAPPAGTRARSAPSVASVHTGTWSCTEVYDLFFTSPFGQPPKHDRRRSTAFVVENADHTLTTTYTAEGDSCAWRSRATGPTASAIPGQTCRTNGGGLVTLTSGTTTVSGATSTIHSSTSFVQSVQGNFGPVQVIGTSTSTIGCSRQ